MRGFLTGRVPDACFALMDLDLHGDRAAARVVVYASSMRTACKAPALFLHSWKFRQGKWRSWRCSDQRDGYKSLTVASTLSFYSALSVILSALACLEPAFPQPVLLTARRNFCLLTRMGPPPPGKGGPPFKPPFKPPLSPPSKGSLQRGSLRGGGGGQRVKALKPPLSPPSAPP